MRRIRIGCIADDFTGASDAASFLEAEGMKTLLVNGIPQGTIPEDVDALVLALKTRTEEKSLAVAKTLEALRYLKACGTEKYYIKYCSTFDSTAEGNIGPITDAVMEELGVFRTVLCPSLLVNGRTVRDGKLYVHGVLLEESPMKNHPLTPMHESELKKLMEAQSRYPVFPLKADLLLDKDQVLKETLDELGKTPGRYYVVPDYFEERHGERIIELFGQDLLFTGGSGLLVPLARSLQKKESEREAQKILLLAGSCSAMTLSQIRHFIEAGGETWKIDPDALFRGEIRPQEVWANLRGKSPLLVYSSEDLATREKRPAKKNEGLPALLEKFMADLALLAVSAEYGAIVVAGGETSGAVTQAFGISSYRIGKSIAPGVPVLYPTGARYKLLLKSGNFGSETFFTDAVSLLQSTSPEAMQEVNHKMEESIRIAKSLFQRGKTAGTSANISFRHGDCVYVSRSGSSFDTLDKEDFVKVSLDGQVQGGGKPSKELPLHLALYQQDPAHQAVIHTHSFYATLWSCLPDLREDQVLPAYTPYLGMKLGEITLVPYGKPGSSELFSEFRKKLNSGRGYLLRHHGPVVVGNSMLQAFEGLEELEESARIAWHLRNENIDPLEGSP